MTRYITVRELCGADLGKRVTVWTPTQGLVGILSSVTHEGAVITDTLLCDKSLYTHIGRVTHTVTVDGFAGEVPGDCDVEVHE